MSKAEINNLSNGKQEDIANVLIADNDSELARFMLEILARKGIRGHLANDKDSAIDFINKGSCDLVFTGDRINRRANLSRRPQDGFELLEKIKANWPELPVIMITEAKNRSPKNQQRTIETAVRAVRQGCCDFLIKPLDCEKIETLLDTFLPNHSVSTIDSAYEDTRCLYRIVGRSAKLVQTVELAKRIAPTSAPVLISGESGTGKELLSYLVHQKSKRAHASYIKINCAALSDSLLESELFGHEKGAFTGAYTQRKGRFEMAHGGTLLLDEIAETPIRFQAKLLRVLEQQDFERVGGNEIVKVDVRIVSTTNKDLLQEVQQGRFRQDLYYRLSGVRLVACPLRERKDDLYDLVWYFVNLYAREVQRRITKLDSAMMDIFAKYHWPGNVRQLRNVVRTSLILGVGQTLSLADVSWLFDELQPLPQESPSSVVSRLSSVEQETRDERRETKTDLGGVSLEQVERRAILDTLRQTGGNQTKAAKVLGISDRTLRDRIHRYRRQGCLQLA
ncbi:MAG: sigma-54-dependent Fis family transcriptional regulator [Planctomycetes bacterium]|nr:sigma-54-dependent Fis family transcriptional regulator [Planctomycetota bacterium]MCH8118465.1 sigma-54-dependent Fis family transcriptional regulator [Planctomycetota bacterium]